MACKQSFAELAQAQNGTKKSDCDCNGASGQPGGASFESVNAAWFKENSWWIILAVTLITLLKN